MKKEGERLLAKLPTTVRLVLCDPGGKAHDSAGFAAMLRQYRESGQDVAFVVGGAFGIGEVVRARPHTRIALAPWTLPHELARLVLAEQLYRAGTIVRGEPYHKS
jgi:23S rRNA (pseudouridine1915-N3)-methyltransferase